MNQECYSSWSTPKTHPHFNSILTLTLKPGLNPKTGPDKMSLPWTVPSLFRLTLRLMQAEVKYHTQCDTAQKGTAHYIFARWMFMCFLQSVQPVSFVCPHECLQLCVTTGITLCLRPLYIFMHSFICVSACAPHLHIPVYLCVWTRQYVWARIHT